MVDQSTSGAVHRSYSLAMTSTMSPTKTNPDNNVDDYTDAKIQQL